MTLSPPRRKRRNREASLFGRSSFEGKLKVELAVKWDPMAGISMDIK